MLASQVPTVPDRLKFAGTTAWYGIVAMINLHLGDVICARILGGVSCQTNGHALVQRHTRASPLRQLGRPQMASATSVSLGDIKRARDAVRDYINLSPCNLSPSLSGRSECKLHLKMENLQRAGAYKDRGAMSAVLGLGRCPQESRCARGLRGQPPWPHLHVGRVSRDRDRVDGGDAGAGGRRRFCGRWRRGYQAQPFKFE